MFLIFYRSDSNTTLQTKLLLLPLILMAMQLPSSSSSSSLSNNFIYDVFISFRGTDTRFGFTGNLYKALSDKGINTFIDYKELQRGDKITPSLFKSIENSRIAIVVFSKDYASSSFCLDELVHITHCSKEKGRLVLPVFYGVEPSHVRYLNNNSYGEALAKHEERFQNNKENMERLQKWKIALNQAANLSGHHFNQGNEYERDFVEKIVTDVSNKINQVPLYVADYLVGLESRISEVNSLLDLGSNDGVCMIGILGTGGLGKTTLAQVVYDLIDKHFECSCFLHNVSENSLKHGLEYLQEQLLFKSIGLKTQFGHVNEGIAIIKRRLCQKKVLLILDDIDKLKQLQVLVGKPGWLGRGSRVIITTRDKHLLSSHGITKIYEAYGLNKEQALELLKTKAFKSKKIDSSYDYILNRAVKYASGLPLALEVVGSNFFGKSIEKCESLLDKYERIPHEDIQKILKVSFHALDEEQKGVFLDIACFFKGCELTYVEEILQCHYGHCIKSDIGVLVEKSLIKINTRYGLGEYDAVKLHDLIEDMGKEIVRQESIKDPGKRSRLWYHDDIVDVLQNNKGTNKIEMIYLNSEEPELDPWKEKYFRFVNTKKELVYLKCPSLEHTRDSGKDFKKMTGIKTLIIKNGQFSESPEYLPSTLKVLIWKRYPLQSLSSSIFSQKFNYMKILTLNDSEYLTHIPDVSGLQNLEKFSFQLCRNLITIHNSVGNLNKLEILDAWGCIKLESFPPLRLPSLKELTLSKCKSLKSFPKLLCKMTSIKKIVLESTSIGELPFSFQNLSELRDIRISGSRRLVFREHNDKMYSIVFLNVEHLELVNNNLSDVRLSILLKWCGNLKHLDLSNSNFKILHRCFSECHLLRDLKLDECKSLKEIRGLPPNLEAFSAIKCESLSFPSRRMLLKKLCEAGCTKIILPNGKEGIPDWFEHQIRGNTISFWFRKKIPSLAFIILSGLGTETYFRLFVNDFNLFPARCICDKYAILPSEHAFFLNLELKRHIFENFENKPELKIKLKKNEWNHVELNWGKDFSDFSVEMGIHVLKEKSNTEEDVIFTNPYRTTTTRPSYSQSLFTNIPITTATTTKPYSQSLITNYIRTTATTTKPYYSQSLFANPPLKLRKVRRMPRKQGFVKDSETESFLRRSLEDIKSDREMRLEVTETEISIANHHRKLRKFRCKPRKQGFVKDSETESFLRRSLEDIKSDREMRLEVTETESLIANHLRKLRKFRCMPRKQGFVKDSETESLLRRSLEDTKSYREMRLDVFEIKSLFATNRLRKVRKFRRMPRKQGFVKDSETESLLRRSSEDTKSDREMRLEISVTKSLIANRLRKLRKFRRKPRKQGFVKDSKAESFQRQSLEDTKSDGEMRLGVTETESLQQQDLALLISGMRNLVLTGRKQRKHD